ncbi:MAG: protein TolQ [Candidatus Lernaella stagnicola]|nr:protein TolQ [Candidatus Lernaella stagnicola]
MIQQILCVIAQVPAESANVIDLVKDAGLVVKSVLALLVVFSVVSWAIIFLKWLLLRRAQNENEIFLRAFWESRQLDDIHRHSKQLIHAPVAEVFAAGFEELKRFRQQGDAYTTEGPAPMTRSTVAGARENVARALQRSAADQIAKLEKAIPFLATVGNTAPFIGLFGTVWGIMDSFQSIGASGQASLAVVAPGISEALVATAVGLFAAIPAVVFYNHFSAKLRSLEGSIESFSSEFMNILERHILK